MAIQAESVIYHQRMSIAPETAWLRDVRRELQSRVGAKVRELRALRGWSQPELGTRIAKVLDELEPDRPPTLLLTHQSTISRIEGGRQTLSLEIIEVLARALEVDPLELVEPAFAKAPRDAEEIERLRREQFTEKLDRLYRDRMRGPLGAEALKAITEVLLTWPDQEAEAFVQGVRREVAGRRQEQFWARLPGSGEKTVDEIFRGRDQARDIVDKILKAPEKRTRIVDTRTGKTLGDFIEQ